MKSRSAIYAGSFDPLTKGHLWVISRTVRLFDKLTVAIGENPEKTYFLSTEQRKKDMVTAVSALPIHECQVEVTIIKNQFLAEYAREIEAHCLVRGLRSEEDFSYEYAMSLVNRKVNPNLESIYILPPPHLAQVSSSLVKGMIGPMGWQELVANYVEPHTLELLKNRREKSK